MFPLLPSIAHNFWVCSTFSLLTPKFRLLQTVRVSTWRNILWSSHVLLKFALNTNLPLHPLSSVWEWADRSVHRLVNSSPYLSYHFRRSLSLTSFFRASSFLSHWCRFRWRYTSILSIGRSKGGIPANIISELSDNILRLIQFSGLCIDNSFFWTVCFSNAFANIGAAYNIL